MKLYGGNNVDYEVVPAGLTRAICYGVIGLGNHTSEQYGSTSPKLMVMFELPDHRIDVNGKSMPRALSSRYTASLKGNTNHFRDFLVNWRGRAFSDAELEAGFEPQKLIGVNAMINVIHWINPANQKPYANIGSIMGSKENLPLENPQVFFDPDIDAVIPSHVPEWIQKIINKSDDWRGGFNLKPKEGVQNVNQVPTVPINHGPVFPPNVGPAYAVPNPEPAIVPPVNPPPQVSIPQAGAIAVNPQSMQAAPPVQNPVAVAGAIGANDPLGQAAESKGPTISEDNEIPF